MNAANPLLLGIRSLIFYLGFIPFTCLFSSTCFIVAPFLPFHKRYHYVVSWNRFVIWWIKVSCGVNYQIIGQENIPSQSCVIVSKHQSDWETVHFQTLFAPTSTILKKELLLPIKMEL